MEILGKEYGYVAIVVVLYCFLNMWMVAQVGKALKKYKIFYPTLQALESGNKDAKLFNCVQRGHHNSLEMMHMFFVLLILGGMGHPFISTALGLVYIVTRYFYFTGYATEAIKCMRHSRRTKLTTDDVDCALNLRNVEPVYSFTSEGPLQFKRAIVHRDLFYLDDRGVNLKEVIEATLPKAPLDTGVVCHWLAIEGVQPVIPENAPVGGLLVVV